MNHPQKPNIIIIFADDLGYGDLSCFNPSSKITTRNLDSLAAGGMRFVDCHSSSALCTPSRYGLLTGRYNWRSRLKSAVLPGQAPPLIEKGRETIPSLLKKSGYQTACIGKWHLGLEWKTNPGYDLPETYSDSMVNQDRCFSGIDFSSPIKEGPLTRGFDYFYGMPASLDQPPFVRIENDRVLAPPDHMTGVKNLVRHNPSQPYDVEYGPAEPDFDPSAVVPEMDEKVLSLIDEYAEGEKPFFIYYPTLAVHGPLVPTKQFQGKSGLNTYADFVLQLDDMIGRVMAKLSEKGIEDNTLVLFASDNGCSPVANFPELISKGHNPSHIYRGWKADIWEGGHRVPFIIRWPGHIPAGAACHQMICLTDVFATIAGIIKMPFADNAGEDSVSLLPLIEGNDAPVREYIVHHAADGSFSIRKGPWKLELCRGSAGMRRPCTDERLPPFQLYHLDGDITEQYNLYGSHPEIEKELMTVLQRYIQQGRSTPGEAQSNYPSDNWPGLLWMDQLHTE